MRRACVAVFALAGLAAGEESVGSLISKSQSAPQAERIAAIERLGMLRAEAALDPLKAALADPDVDVRREAIEALGRFAKPELLPLLASCAADPDPRIAGDAVRALADSGFAALPHLVDALRHPVPAVASAALDAARRVTGVRAGPDDFAAAAISAKGDRFAFLAAILARRAGPRAAGDALRALPDDAKSAPLLVDALESDAEPIRVFARKRLEALACRRFPDAPSWRAWLAPRLKLSLVDWRAEALRDAANPLRLAAARGLAVPDAEAVRALMSVEADGAVEEGRLASLADATGLNARPRDAWAAWWAANHERTRLEWLLAALLDPADAPNRAAAARALRSVRDRRSVDHLVGYGLRDADPAARAASADALAGLTGQGWGSDAARWEGWWAKEGAGWK